MNNLALTNLSEELSGKQWNFEPFIACQEELLGKLWESSGLGYRLLHSQRVFLLVDQMRYYPELQAVQINWPLVKTAALFHDAGLAKVGHEVGKLDIFQPDVFAKWVGKHAEYGPEVIRQSIGHLLTESELDEVCRLARDHMDYGKATDPALQVLQDADNLDELGLIGIWRMSAIANNHELSFFSQVEHHLREEMLSRAETLSLLHFPSSRSLGQARVDSFRQAFLTFWHQTNGLDLPFSAESFSWDRWDSIIQKHGWQIDRPKDSAHPSYPDIIYPLDYGYINGVLGWDGMEQDIFVGNEAGPLTGIIMTADFHKRDREFKLLWGLSELQMEQAERFFNARPTQMIGRLIKRSKPHQQE